MDPRKWQKTIDELFGLNIDQAVKAIETLDRVADSSDVLALYRLLDDPSFFIREAAASPLARLEGVKALPRLLEALTRGKEDGHDNDTLVVIIADLLEEHPARSLPVMRGMLNSPQRADRLNAAWAIGFLHTVTSSQPLLELLTHEKDPDIRAVALDSLSSFKN